MTNYSELEAYFQALAEKHVYINHSESEKHFYRIDVEEYLTTEPEVRYPYFSLERAEFNLSGENDDNISKNRSVAFMIVNNFREGDYNRVNEIYSETEKVAEDIINRIGMDVRSMKYKSLLRDVKIRQASVQHLPIIPVNLTCGVRVLLPVQSKYDSSVDASVWNDL